MTIKIITTILLCCATAFASQEPTTLEQFQTLQKIFTSINYGYPKTATAIGSNDLVLATINSEEESDTFDSPKDAYKDRIFFNIKKYSFDDTTETVLQNETKTQIDEKFLLDNWAIARTPSFFIDVLANDTVICAHINGNYTMIEPTDANGNFTIGKPSDQSYTHKKILDCESKDISITALSCTKNISASDILFGLSNGKIIKINSGDLANPITLQEANNNAITSLHCLSNDKIIFSQEKTLYSLDSNITSNVPQMINLAKNRIEHTALFENAVAYCKTDNSLTIIFDINNHDSNIFQMDIHQSKVNAICLHKKLDIYYLYIGDEDGNLTIWEISSDENNRTSQVFATIPHNKTSILSIEMSHDDNYIVIKTVQCYGENGTIMSNKIISYPTPDMLKGCFKQHTNIYDLINRTFNTKKNEENSALKLYTLLKNYQSFLLTFPSNSDLAEQIQTHIKNSIGELTLVARESQAMVIEYLKKIKETIGIDFKQNKHKLKIGEPLTPFNKTLSQQTINIVMDFLIKRIANDKIRTSIINDYPLLKTSARWIEENNPQYGEIKISKIDYTEIVEPRNYFTPQNILRGFVATIAVTFCIALATYLYTLSKK